ncbi:MAG: HD domain-containing phosphohydrolase [Acidobacteriota bacterium]
MSPGDEKKELTEQEDAQERLQSDRELETQSPRSANASGEGSLVERIAQEELAHPPESSQEQEIDLPARQAAAASLYREATVYVLKSIRRVEKGVGPDVEKGEELVRRVIESLSESSALCLLATDRKRRFSISVHSVNVMVLALRIAGTMKCDHQEQMRVGLAAILHELGIGQVPDRLLHQEGPVREEVRHRPAYSAEVLARFCPKYGWLAETAGQVYEREDGSGVPSGLAGKDIRAEAKILGIADVFEACIHDRPYRHALTGYQMIYELTKGESRGFSDRIIKALVKSFTMYPYNEYVLLSTHEVGQVVEVNPENLMRPVVKILYDREGKPLNPSREIDLAKNPSLHILQAVLYHTLPARYRSRQ